MYNVTKVNSVEEWVNGNQLSIDIINKKYLQEGETFEEWCDRITGGNEDYKRLFIEKKFIPGGRILSNRGLDNKSIKATMSNCFIPGTMVMTKNGYKPIETIEIGELVMTHDGTWQIVNEVMCREYSGDIYEIQNKSKMFGSVFCTPNHKFLNQDGEWKEIKDWVTNRYKIKDKFITPKFIFNEVKETIVDLTDGYAPDDTHRLSEVVDNKIGVCEFVIDKGTPVWKKPRVLVNSTCLLDEKFAYFIGRWIGDGSITKRKNKINHSILQIVFNANTEKEMFETCREVGIEKFGIQPSVTENKKQNTIILRFENEIISSWFYKHFGEKCDGKFISELISNSTSALLGLLDSDGSVHSNQRIKLLMKNGNVIEWARNTLYNSGVNVGVISNEKRQDAKSFTITVSESQKILPFLTKKYKDDRMLLKEHKDNFIIPNQIIVHKNINTKVYNLSVEKNHSYVVNGIIAHNCYVLSVDDSIESIYDTCSKMARTYSYGGGVGIDISKLRPCGAIVKNSARTTTGAVSFMRTFDIVTGTIGQNGRRGALMISMDVSHPDVTEFINIKANTDQITNANISVRVNDKFMEAVKNDDDYILHWPCDMTISDEEINAINKYNELVMVETNCGPVYLKKIKAKELFMQLAKNNWDYGEPGILYWDRISSYHLMSENKDFEYAGVNPCAEEPLPNGGACLLGSMNLYQYVVNGLFDYEAFTNDCKIATRWLNDIQKEGGELHPLQVQRDTARDYKQIGLGIFDLAGALIKMGVKYGSKQAQDIAREITRTMLIAAFEQSCDLNTEGKEYPNMFDSEFYKKQVEPYIAEQYKGRYPLNSQILTIAPTGTISTMLNATAGGGEPMFALFYIRSTKSIGETDYKVYPQCVLDYFGENEVDEEKLPDYYISSDMISPKERIEMQAALQENIDASISSTINLPEKTTVQDVYDIYMYAWESGLKGVTIFRDGCKRVAILNRTEKKNNECVFNTVNAPKRPKSLDADYYQVKVKGENFIIIVGLLDGKPYELFALPCDNCQKVKNHRGKVIRVKKREYKFESDILTIDNIAIEPGIYNINDEVSKISEIVNDGHKLNKIETDAIKDSIYKIIDWSEKREYRNVALHVSGNLRTGMRIEDIVKLEDKCADSIVSFPKAIGRVLSKYMEASELDDICPECGEKLIREGGCIHCPNCGWGKCL